MDFFTVPTITFGVLYCFFIVNVTKHPSGIVRTDFRLVLYIYVYMCCGSPKLQPTVKSIT